MIGTQIGPFVVLRLLGAGGMGSVYLAEHSLMKDLHAIKILDPQLTQQPQVVTRFINEARAAARLRHRNLIRVHNIDRMPDDGPWYMVLDYLDGSTLARFIAAHDAPIAPQLIVHILAQVASCIQHVHDHQIVHRDLKPDNIFLVRVGDDPHVPIVLDLGIAQLNEDLSAGPVTGTGMVLGTPLYMAPEQLRGERVSAAADVFALGVIAYEMSTGGYLPYQYDEDRPSYVRLPATEIYYRQRTAPPVPPKRRNLALPDAWVDVIVAALDLEPARRPASAGELARLLAAAVPPDRAQPGGLEILRQVAPELVQRSDGSGHRLVAHPRRETQPHGDATATPRPISTLAGSASQSVPIPRVARRWGVVAVAAASATIAGAIAALLLGRSPTALTPPAKTVEALPATILADAAPPIDAPPIDAPPIDDAPAPRAAPPAPATTPPPIATPRRTGELAIIVRPWALVWLDGKPLGQTPIRKRVPAGRYSIRIANDVTGKDETVSVTVPPDQTTTLQRSW